MPASRFQCALVPAPGFSAPIVSADDRLRNIVLIITSDNGAGSRPAPPFRVGRLKAASANPA